MTARKAEQLGLSPLARLASYATVALDPSIMGMGPVPASTKALARAGYYVETEELRAAYLAETARFASLVETVGLAVALGLVGFAAPLVVHPPDHAPRG